MTTQVFRVTDAGGELMEDFVGRHERLQEDFDKICDQLGYFFGYRYGD